MIYSGCKMNRKAYQGHDKKAKFHANIRILYYQMKVDNVVYL